jgi:hypothetical protein
MKKALSAYPETEKTFRGKLKGSSIELDSFNRPLKPCNLNKCKGMCCYDGVYVNEEEDRVITTIWKQHNDFFKSLGIPAEEAPIIETELNGRKRRKTATKPRAFSQIVNNYPKFFSDTACIFLTKEGHCSLQLLSIHQSRHKWYYKPLTCSLHPISISFLDKRIFLPTEDTDPHRSEGYAGYSSQTQCGQLCSDGPLAKETLAEELQFLANILSD